MAEATGLSVEEVAARQEKLKAEHTEHSEHTTEHGEHDEHTTEHGEHGNAEDIVNDLSATDLDDLPQAHVDALALMKQEEEERVLREDNQYNRIIAAQRDKANYKSPQTEKLAIISLIGDFSKSQKNKYPLRITDFTDPLYGFVFDTLSSFSERGTQCTGVDSFQRELERDPRKGKIFKSLHGDSLITEAREILSQNAQNPAGDNYNSYSEELKKLSELRTLASQNHDVSDFYIPECVQSDFFDCFFYRDKATLKYKFNLKKYEKLTGHASLTTFPPFNDKDDWLDFTDEAYSNATPQIIRDHIYEQETKRPVTLGNSNSLGASVSPEQIQLHPQTSSGLPTESGTDLLHRDLCDIFKAQLPSSWSAKERKEPECWIEDWMYKGTCNSIVAAAKIGKSQLAYAYAWHIQNGYRWFHKKVSKGNVLYYDFELTKPNIAKRIRQLKLQFGRPDNPDEREFPIIPVQPDKFAKIGIHAFVREVVAKQIEEYNADIVFFDCFYRFHKGDPNDQTQVTDTLEALKYLQQELNVTVIYVTHTNKAGFTNMSDIIYAAGGSGAHGMLVDETYVIVPDKPDKAKGKPGRKSKAELAELAELQAEVEAEIEEDLGSMGSISNLDGVPFDETTGEILDPSKTAHSFGDVEKSSQGQQNLSQGQKQKYDLFIIIGAGRDMGETKLYAKKSKETRFHFVPRDELDHPDPPKYIEQEKIQAEKDAQELIMQEVITEDDVIAYENMKEGVFRETGIQLLSSYLPIGEYKPYIVNNSNQLMNPEYTPAKDGKLAAYIAEKKEELKQVLREIAEIGELEDSEANDATKLETLNAKKEQLFNYIKTWSRVSYDARTYRDIANSMSAMVFNDVVKAYIVSKLQSFKTLLTKDENMVEVNDLIVSALKKDGKTSNVPLKLNQNYGVIDVISDEILRDYMLSKVIKEYTSTNVLSTSSNSDKLQEFFELNDMRLGYEKLLNSPAVLLTTASESCEKAAYNFALTGYPLQVMTEEQMEEYFTIWTTIEVNGRLSKKTLEKKFAKNDKKKDKDATPMTASTTTATLGNKSIGDNFDVLLAFGVVGNYMGPKHHSWSNALRSLAISRIEEAYKLMPVYTAKGIAMSKLEELLQRDRGWSDTDCIGIYPNLVRSQQLTNIELYRWQMKNLFCL